MSEPPLVTQMWSRDSFGIKSEKGLRKTAQIITAYQITAPVEYTVAQISALPDLPATDSTYPGLSDMHALNRDFQRAGPNYWICLVTYEGTNIDPVGEPPEISWTHAQSEEPIDEDWNGRPIVTFNGEPIEGVTMQLSDNVLNVKRNFRTFSPHTTHQYMHSVNSDTFANFPPGTGRLTQYDARQIHNAQSGGYWEVTARVEFRWPYRTTAARAWYARVRHEGYYERLPSGLVVRAVDDQKEDVSRPVLLKADGTRETNPNNAYWLEIQRYGALPYSALGLL